MHKMPTWKVPKNITKALEGDGFWEDERWSPIQVTAMFGTEYDGREIPVAWQIEFDPSEEDFEAANGRLEEMEIEPDGWLGRVHSESYAKGESCVGKEAPYHRLRNGHLRDLGRIGRRLPRASRNNVEAHIPKVKPTAYGIKRRRRLAPVV